MVRTHLVDGAHTWQVVSTLSCQGKTSLQPRRLAYVDTDGHECHKNISFVLSSASPTPLLRNSCATGE